MGDEWEEITRRESEAFEVIGKLLASFSALEFHMIFLVANLLTGHSDDPAAVIGASRQRFVERIEAIRMLLILRVPKMDRERLGTEKLLEDLDRLRRLRNKFAHGIWHPTDYAVNGGEIAVHSPRAEFDKAKEDWKLMRRETFPIETLRGHISEIAGLLNELTAVAKEVKSVRIHPPAASN